MFLSDRGIMKKSRRQTPVVDICLLHGVLTLIFGYSSFAHFQPGELQQELPCPCLFEIYRRLAALARIFDVSDSAYAEAVVHDFHACDEVCIARCGETGLTCGGRRRGLWRGQWLWRRRAWGGCDLLPSLWHVT